MDNLQNHRRPPVRPPSPLLEIEVGFACPNECVFCSEGDFSLHPGLLAVPTPERLSAILSGTAPPFRLRFGGREPLTRTDLPLLARIAREAGAEEIGVVTNGRRLADLPWLETLIEAGVTRFEVSLHGPDPTVHDALTRAPGSFADTRAGLWNLARLQAARRPIRHSIQLTLVRANLPHLRAMADLAHETRASTLVLLWLQAHGHARRAYDELAIPFGDLLSACARLSPPPLPVRVLGLPLCVGLRLPPGLNGERHAVTVHDNLNLSATHGLGARSAPPPACRLCAAFDACPGVDDAHRLAFGEADLTPLSVAEFEALIPGDPEPSGEKAASILTDRSTLRRLVAPLDTESRGGWRLAELEPGPERARFVFVRDSGLTLAFWLTRAESAPSADPIGGYALSFDGTRLPDAGEKFARVLREILRRRAALLTAS